MCTKICGSCKKELPETEEFFATKKLKTKTILQWQCRECQKEYRKNHYEANKAKYISKSKAYRQTSMEEFFELKKNLKCNRCPEDRWWVLDFHHINPEEKDTEVGALFKSGSKSRALKEIEKCEVLCSNCHRDLHYKERIGRCGEVVSRDTSNV